ncbi:MAG: hypothetical protein QXE05_04635 [Nitrososphaeria archaeon]
MSKRGIDAETKEFVKEVFEWIKTSGVERGFIRKDWKNHLIDIIAEEMKKEGKVVKRESIRRNLNRMIAFYYETGAQARSGKQYLKYLEKFITSIQESFELAGAMRAQYFLSLEDARLYVGDITVLYEMPSWRDKMFIVYRYYPE